MYDSMEPPLEITDDDAVRKRIRRRKFFAVLIAVAILAIGLAALLLQTGSRYSSSSSSSVVNHPAYEQVQSTTVEEVQADLVVYKHRKTQTQIITLVPADLTQDSAFGISFRTLPSDSTGAAHVLEHSVLSGSAKYPSKDPFNALLRGSLKTFLNALTFPDRTIYAVASRNSADLKNLMSVYLDAVFEPRVVTPQGKWIFRQEGWRVEENGDDGLEFNGVVMSEMKGAYSDPEELLYTYSQTALFPDTPYRHDSGGEPSKIPSLTLESFGQFYRKFYHPSNAQIYIYGSKQDVREGLNQADAYLKDSDARPDIREESQVPWQKKNFAEPMKVRKPYPSSEEDNGDYKVMVSWLVNDEVMDPVLEIAWYVLEYLLLGTPTSVLYKALSDSELGDYVIDDGFDDDLQQNMFHVGLEGLEYEEDMDKVEEIIILTLQEVVDHGFKPGDITSAMNSIEFDLRELVWDDYPRGVGILVDGMSAWNYDRDPVSALVFDDAFKELKDIVADSGSEFFVRIVSRLVQNNHRVTVELSPDTALAELLEVEEKDRLQSIPESQLEELIEEFNHMKEVQATDDSATVVASIPSLSVSDLDRTGVEHPIEVGYDARGSGVTVVTHEVPTSFGIAYIDFGLDTSAIDFDDIHLLPLLCRLILEVGKDVPNGDLHLIRRIGSHTGGIELDPSVTPVRPESLSDEELTVLDGSYLHTMLFFRGKCTTENTQPLLSLFRDMLLEGTLDSQTKAISVLKEMISDEEYDVVSEGDGTAYLRIKARYGVVGFIFEELQGVTHMEKLTEVLKLAKNDWGSLLARLENMKNQILSGHRKGMILNLTGDRRVLSSIQDAVNQFLDNHLPPRVEDAQFFDWSTQVHPWVAPSKARMQESAPVVDEAFVVPTQVNYVAKGGVLYQPGEKVDGSASVVSRYISRGYLYEQLRLQRGAYGASSRLDIRAGTLVFTSYRDPNLMSTLEVYDGAAQALRSEVAMARNQHRLPPKAAGAIIGTIGSLDGTAPQPEDVGWLSLRQWLRGETAELRQTWRDQILNTTWSDFEDFAIRLESWSNPSVAVVTSQSAYKHAVSNGLDLTRETPLSKNS